MANLLYLLVPGAGLEPARPCDRGILRPDFAKNVLQVFLITY